LSENFSDQKIKFKRQICIDGQLASNYFIQSSEKKVKFTENAPSSGVSVDPVYILRHMIISLLIKGTVCLQLYTGADDGKSSVI